MITAWLWDTDGPDRRTQGVSATDEDARVVVEEELLSRGATFGSIEMARLIFGPLRSYYELSSFGWTAGVASGVVTWAPFEAPERRAS